MDWELGELDSSLPMLLIGCQPWTLDLPVIFLLWASGSSFAKYRDFMSRTRIIPWFFESVSNVLPPMDWRGGHTWVSPYAEYPPQVLSPPFSALPCAPRCRPELAASPGLPCPLSSIWVLPVVSMSRRQGSWRREKSRCLFTHTHKHTHTHRTSCVTSSPSCLHCSSGWVPLLP